MMNTVEIKIVRGERETVYEAALPIAELMPFVPDMWPKVGVNVVVNDNDGVDPERRKARLELREGAMTRGKNGNRFAVFRCRPSPDAGTASAVLFWRRRATPENGFFRLKLAAYGSPTGQARVMAVLTSLDSPGTESVQESLMVDLQRAPAEHSLRIETDSPPGRCALCIAVEDDRGAVIANDCLPVYVYPAE